MTNLTYILDVQPMYTEYQTFFVLMSWKKYTTFFPKSCLKRFAGVMCFPPEEEMCWTLFDLRTDEFLIIMIQNWKWNEILIAAIFGSLLRTEIEQ